MKLMIFITTKTKMTRKLRLQLKYSKKKPKILLSYLKVELLETMHLLSHKLLLQQVDQQPNHRYYLVRCEFHRINDFVHIDWRPLSKLPMLM